MELNKLIKDCHKTALDKGWWEKPRDFPTVVMMVITELSEAVQEDRKKDDDRYEKTEMEISDTLIRLFDLCGAYFPNIEKAILKKMEFNKNRPYRHKRRY